MFEFRLSILPARFPSSNVSRGGPTPRSHPWIWGFEQLSEVSTAACAHDPARASPSCPPVGTGDGYPDNVGHTTRKLWNREQVSALNGLGGVPPDAHPVEGFWVGRQTPGGGARYQIGYTNKFRDLNLASTGFPGTGNRNPSYGWGAAGRLLRTTTWQVKTTNQQPIKDGPWPPFKWSQPITCPGATSGRVTRPWVYNGLLVPLGKAIGCVPVDTLNFSKFDALVLLGWAT